jgi:hypothetical protein
MIELAISNQIQNNYLPATTHSNSKKGPNLKEMLHQSIATHSPISEKYVSDLQGSVNEINTGFSFALLHALHKFAREEVIAELASKLQSSFDLETASKLIDCVVNLVHIVVWIDKRTNQPTRVIALKYPLIGELKCNKQLGRGNGLQAFYKFVHPSLTTLRNIELHFCTVLVSFPIQMSLESLA